MGRCYQKALAFGRSSGVDKNTIDSQKRRQSYGSG